MKARMRDILYYKKKENYVLICFRKLRMASDTTINRVLMVCPEWGSFLKVGGLADMAASLSMEFASQGVDTRVLLLGYKHIRIKTRRKIFHPSLPFFLIEEGQREDVPGVTFYLLKHPMLERAREPYSSSYSGARDVFSFMQAFLLSLGPILIANERSSAWVPQIVHLHDWPAALFPLLNQHAQKISPELRPVPAGSLLTLHNADHEGNFYPPNKNFHGWLQDWGIYLPHLEHSSFFSKEKISLLQLGMKHATKVNTVSETYAKELLAMESVSGQILRQRNEDFSGILNGIDTSSWSPDSDPYLRDFPYSPAKLSLVKKAKLYWKNQISKQLNFPMSHRVPLLISVARLVEQKGLDDLFCCSSSREIDKMPVLNALAQKRCYVIILGEGEKSQEDELQFAAWNYPTQMLFLNYFHEEMAHMLTAAADFYLMPSRFEPCGLNQIYALKYGSIPIVRSTGGLVDTIQAGVNGYCFKESGPEDFGKVFDEALSLWYKKRRKYHAMQILGMKQDFSWQKSYRKYVELYQATYEQRGASKPSDGN